MIEKERPAFKREVISNRTSLIRKGRPTFTLVPFLRGSGIKKGRVLLKGRVCFERKSLYIYIHIIKTEFDYEGKLLSQEETVERSG